MVQLLLTVKGKASMKLNRIAFLVFSDIVTHSPNDSVREAKTRTKIFGAI